MIKLKDLLTEASRIDEYPSSGPRNDVSISARDAKNSLFDAGQNVFEMMNSLEKDGTVDRKNRQHAVSYKAMLESFKNANRAINVWESVMKAAQKVKHQSRGK